MRCSLFGKLPPRRDFIAVGAPRRFLDAWEPWLQSAIASSRQALGKEWQSAFLSAPIWRFWLGEDICGTSVVGAFMSSLDGIGRYFPLTLFACADDGAAIPPPELDLQAQWFEACETLLLSALDDGASFEEIVARLEQSPIPAQDILCSKSTTLADVFGVAESGFENVFRSIRAKDHHKVYSSSTFWWTIGGEGFPPVALCSKLMPDPYLFSAMMSGEFEKAQP
jgi:type VI secretion system protein ImpM